MQLQYSFTPCLEQNNREACRNLVGSEFLTLLFNDEKCFWLRNSMKLTRYFDAIVQANSNNTSHRINLSYKVMFEVNSKMPK